MKSIIQVHKQRNTMSKAEKFIKDYTNHCSNIIINNTQFGGVEETQPWLTPDNARKAVEIAREGVIEKAYDAYCKVCGHYAHTTPVHICRQACDYYKDFKQTMKDET